LKLIKGEQLEHHIEYAVVEFLCTGESKELQTKQNSVCHFFEEFQIENDIIVLRLDWSDVDEHGHPTIDADFYDKNTFYDKNKRKKLSLKGDRKDAHHTSSTGEGQRSYSWEFKGNKLKFRVKVRCLLSLQATYGFSSSCTLE
jgi:hypothetical protein